MQAIQRFSGSALRQRRLRAGLTQSELARKARLREQQIVRWEGGKNIPRADAVAVLAGALNVEVGELFEPADGDDEDDEESDLLDAAHALDRAGEYGLADRLRSRAREAARASARVVS